MSGPHGLFRAGRFDDLGAVALGIALMAGGHAVHRAIAATSRTVPR